MMRVETWRDKEKRCDEVLLKNDSQYFYMYVCVKNYENTLIKIKKYKTKKSKYIPKGKT